jgi:glycosyltransferase involved in cell wall biosynthesis
VTVIIPTYNRRAYLPAALESACEQTYRNLQVLVVNDGGPDVRDIISAQGDSRVRLLDRRENRGKARSLNDALGVAEGKYVAYLDDDDVYYPHHVQTLVDLLEGDTDCGVAYSDLYKTHCRILPDGSREVLGKVVNISRDFDRWFLMLFNHVLHVSMMHRRDLLEKTGLYSEDVRVLIDWDMTRRLAFFTDFIHTNEITGEFFGPVGECDRISYRMRIDRNKYFETLLRIRSSRPPKPWPKMPDLSIVYAPDKLDPQAIASLKNIYVWTFAPFRVFLAATADDLARVNLHLPNLTTVTVASNASRDHRIRAALDETDGDHVALLHPGVQFQTAWVETALHTLHYSNRPREGVYYDAGQKEFPAAVFRADELKAAARDQPDLPIRSIVTGPDWQIREPRENEHPFGYDRMLTVAQELESEGDMLRAGHTYRRMRERYGNELRMDYLAARAYAELPDRRMQAMELCRRLNDSRPTVDSLMLEAKLHRQAERLEDAMRLLERAQCILRRKG